MSTPTDDSQTSGVLIGFAATAVGGILSATLLHLILPVSSSGPWRLARPALIVAVAAFAGVQAIGVARVWNKSADDAADRVPARVRTIVATIIAMLFVVVGPAGAAVTNPPVAEAPLKAASATTTIAPKIAGDGSPVPEFGAGGGGGAVSGGGTVRAGSAGSGYGGIIAAANNAATASNQAGAISPSVGGNSNAAAPPGSGSPDATAPASGPVVATAAPNPGDPSPPDTPAPTTTTPAPAPTTTLPISQQAPGQGLGSPPVANADVVETVGGDTITIDPAANDTDVDGDLDPTTLIVTYSPDGRLVLQPSGKLMYTSASYYVGTDAFGYMVCDRQGNCRGGLVTIHVAQSPSVSTPPTTATPGGPPPSNAS